VSAVPGTVLGWDKSPHVMGIRLLGRILAVTVKVRSPKLSSKACQSSCNACVLAVSIK
jgi:hypothetical protein